ncbi:MAG TPA: hypothetical protein VMU84_17515, partial [Thermoanaerobaculia bacterium]|nr:hypothetical protein [Thermoanaerobaculia bacterium]
GHPFALPFAMRCPECHALNEADAAACATCGLLLLNIAPKRRSEDLAIQRRRSGDQETALCRFCGGDIAPDAIRCRHCSEIVNDSYYRERAQRIRSRVNYASWVAYLFGLGALLVFRPVGMLSIAAGLLLSIAYYAIPAEPIGSKKKGLISFITRQVRIERVAIPIPAFRKRKLIFVGTPLIAAVIGYSANLFLLQEPVNDILRENAAFRGMNISAHYQYWIVPGVVVYDLRELSVRQTPIDVQTAFLEFAKRLRAKKYDRIELSYRGTTKFSIDGASFRRLGDEFHKGNLDYVLYSFPRLFRAEDGAKTPDAKASDRDALLQFHRQWYGEDPLTQSVANGLR